MTLTAFNKRIKIVGDVEKNMPKMKFLCLGFFLLSTLLADSSAQDIGNYNSPGDSILRCSDHTDLTEMSNCFRRRFSEMQRKTSESKFSYPSRTAPALPTYLISDPPPNSISPDRKRTDFSGLQKRMQGYTEPQYRNYLDLNPEIQQRVAEFRPIFDNYVIPVFLRPSHDPYNNHIETDFYSDQVKPKYGKKLKKGYGQSLHDEPAGYYADKYSSLSEDKYNRDSKQHIVKEKKYKPNSSYSRSTQSTKFNSYDEDYYVPANSPIMGDIRRSLMDYTGASDLMVVEPEYRVSSQIIQAMGNDFYPFRKTYTRDLQVNGSNRYKSRASNQQE